MARGHLFVFIRNGTVEAYTWLDSLEMNRNHGH